MPNDQDTAQVAETGAEVIGNAEEQSAVVSDTPSVPETKQPETQTNDELERLRKERDQAAMRANQLENAAKERDRREAEEAGRYKELYEAKLAEEEARAAQEAEEKRQQDAKQLRDEAVDNYKNEKVRELAKNLLEDDDTLFFWGDNATSKEEATAQVTARLDKLATKLGLNADETDTTQEEQPIMDANNPLPESGVKAGGVDMKALEKKLANFKF